MLRWLLLLWCWFLYGSICLLFTMIQHNIIHETTCAPKDQATQCLQGSLRAMPKIWGLSVRFTEWPHFMGEKRSTEALIMTLNSGPLLPTQASVINILREWITEKSIQKSTLIFPKRIVFVLRKFEMLILATEKALSFLLVLVLTAINVSQCSVCCRNRKSYCSYLIAEEEQKGTAKKRYHLYSKWVCMSLRRAQGDEGAGGWDWGRVNLRRREGKGGLGEDGGLLEKGTKRFTVSSPKHTFPWLTYPEGKYLSS